MLKNLHPLNEELLSILWEYVHGKALFPRSERLVAEIFSHDSGTQNVPCSSIGLEGRVPHSGRLIAQVTQWTVDMAAVPDTGPIWWDRDVDDQGVPIRADVRQAAHDLWPEAIKRVRRTLFDPSEAAELMEDTVIYISRHLDRVQAPLFAPSVPSLLSLHFSQELRRLAGKRGRIRLVGHGSSIEERATVEGWAERIDRHIDFEKIVCSLNERSRTIVAMRMQEHEWEVIGDKLGMLPATVRRAFWKDLREVLLRMRCPNGSGQKEANK